MQDRRQKTRARAHADIPGVVETIGLAYTRLFARPWIVLGPILLDLYLWLGLKITAGPLMLKVADAVRPVEKIGDSIAGFLERQQQFNLSELLSMQLFTIRMPTFMPWLVSDETVRLSGWAPEHTDGPWWVLAIVVPVLLIAGFAVGAAFLVILGDVARGTRPAFDVKRIVTAAYRLAFWILAGAGFFVLITWPLIVAQGAFIYFGTGVIDLITFLLFIPAGAGFVLFFFSAFAIVLDGASATQSFRSSYRVVRSDGWQSMAFIVSFMVITGGFPFFWRILATVPPGTLIAIIGNAFVSTGMLAAGMIYYENRASIVKTVGADAPATSS